MPPKPLAEQLVALSQEAWTPTHAGCETKYRQLLTKCQQLVAAVERYGRCLDVCETEEPLEDDDDNLVTQSCTCGFEKMERDALAPMEEPR